MSIQPESIQRRRALKMGVGVGAGLALAPLGLWARSATAAEMETKLSIDPAQITEKNPYYPVPPGGSLKAFGAWVDSLHSPRATWEQIHIGPGQVFEETEQFKPRPGARCVIHVHYRPETYGVLDVKAAHAVEVIGIPGSRGEHPIMNSINMTRAYNESRGNPIIAGGLIVHNLRLLFGQNRAIGVPSDCMFVSVEDCECAYTGHHILITSSDCHHLYYRMVRSHFHHAASHLAYINRVARADFIDSVLESPGWGHALRSIARVTHISGCKVSNINLDGTISPQGINPHKPNQTYIGMHPIDLYAVADTECFDNEVVYYRMQSRNIPVPINVRYRDGMGSPDVSYKDGDRFQPLTVVTSQEYYTRAYWDDLRARGDDALFTIDIDRNLLQIVGPERFDCHGIGITGGSYPIMERWDSVALRAWLRDWWKWRDQTASLDELWLQLLNDLPYDRWAGTADLVHDDRRGHFMRGKGFISSMPYAAPVPHWFQQQTVRIGSGNELLVCDGGACEPSPQDMRRPDPPSNYAYYGERDERAQSAGPSYRHAWEE